ncbi:MAG TPA: hypothetical protein VGF25_04260 [Thermoleophilaceae bacterium]|jgi:hypothetical protein
MNAAETTSEVTAVERWRAEALSIAGYGPEGAALLATRPDVDLHAAIDLLRRGCPEHLALQILL